VPKAIEKKNGLVDFYIKPSSKPIDFSQAKFNFSSGIAMRIPLSSQPLSKADSFYQSNSIPVKFHRNSVHPSTYSIIKRCIDIIGALVGLGILAVLYVPISFAIKLDSPGPIFYSQIRCGYRGQPFRIWKFRSMVANADALKSQVENQAQGFIFKNDNDPRITRVGKFLRRTSLDEFPQFWNVLKGDMSLVGTRPPTVDEVNQYKPHHWQRLNVKPGLTGRWQAKGRSLIHDFEDVVKMDIDYQKEWSLFHDVELIFETLKAVVVSRGAY
jgi:lipopolysaccharide/colanic/teichoic acid biosynthesis glycosyltransferase